MSAVRKVPQSGMWFKLQAKILLYQTRPLTKAGS